jgi:Domain of unknown function (DUF4410)
MKKLSASFNHQTKFPVFVISLFSLLMTVGCASTKVTKQQQLVTENLQCPNRILVQDFVTNPADVSKDSVINGKTKTKTTPPTKEEHEIGRKLGVSIASQLIKEINAMGLKAEKITSTTKPQINDIVLRGYILSVEQGGGAKRVIVGFGYGAAGLQTLVEGYQMTAKGLRKLGSAAIEAGGNKTPGGAVGAVTLLARANPIGLVVGGAVKGYGEISGDSKVQGLAKDSAATIAKNLKLRFKKQGWVK